MIRWFEENPVGVVLVALAGLLLFVSLMLGVVWSLPPSAEPVDPASADSDLSLDVPELTESEPIDRYAVITERPVFNPSRQPEVMLDPADDALEEELEEEVDAPEVELAGVIITPSLRMVTLKQKESEESLVAFEGQPLEGDYGSWHVSQIEPRQITLSSGSGEHVELSLVIHDQAMQAPAVPEKENAESASPAENEKSSRDSDAPLTRAEEIRQRIAQRREELRRAAEENSADAVEPVENDQPERYRTAMEELMARGQKQKNNDENE